MIIENKLLYNLDNLVAGKPITADLFLTNYCNNRCKYCTYKRWELSKEERRYVTFKEFKRNVKILQKYGVKGFILTGGGEPCINPDFDKITQWMDTNNIQYGINTNFNIYKECHPEWLKIALDTWNEDEYEAIRGVKKYNNVIENIRRFAENKGKTKIVIQCLVTKQTDVFKFYEGIKDLNIDYIVFRPLESTNGKDFHLQNFDAVEQIKNIKDTRIVLNYKWGELLTKFEECYASRYRIALNEKSEVIYCCQKPYEVIGHITEKNIMDKKNKFVTDMSKCDVPCVMTGANKFIKSLEDYPNDRYFI